MNIELLYSSVVCVTGIVCIIAAYVVNRILLTAARVIMVRLMKVLKFSIKQILKIIIFVAKKSAKITIKFAKLTGKTIKFIGKVGIKTVKIVGKVTKAVIKAGRIVCKSVIKSMKKCKKAITKVTDFVCKAYKNLCDLIREGKLQEFAMKIISIFAIVRITIACIKPVKTLITTTVSIADCLYQLTDSVSISPLITLHGDNIVHTLSAIHDILSSIDVFPLPRSSASAPRSSTPRLEDTVVIKRRDLIEPHDDSLYIKGQIELLVDIVFEDSVAVDIYEFIHVEYVDVKSYLNDIITIVTDSMIVSVTDGITSNIADAAELVDGVCMLHILAHIGQQTPEEMFDVLEALSLDESMLHYEDIITILTSLAELTESVETASTSLMTDNKDDIILFMNKQFDMSSYSHLLQSLIDDVVAMQYAIHVILSNSVTHTYILINLLADELQVLSDDIEDKIVELKGLVSSTILDALTSSDYYTVLSTYEQDKIEILRHVLSIITNTSIDDVTLVLDEMSFMSIIEHYVNTKITQVWNTMIEETLNLKKDDMMSMTTFIVNSNIHIMYDKFHIILDYINKALVVDVDTSDDDTSSEISGDDATMERYKYMLSESSGLFVDIGDGVSSIATYTSAIVPLLSLSGISSFVMDIVKDNIAAGVLGGKVKNLVESIVKNSGCSLLGSITISIPYADKICSWAGPFKKWCKTVTKYAKKTYDLCHLSTNKILIYKNKESIWIPLYELKIGDKVVTYEDTLEDVVRIIKNEKDTAFLMDESTGEHPRLIGKDDDDEYKYSCFIIPKDNILEMEYVEFENNKIEFISNCVLYSIILSGPHHTYRILNGDNKEIIFRDTTPDYVKNPCTAIVIYKLFGEYGIDFILQNLEHVFQSIVDSIINIIPIDELGVEKFKSPASILNIKLLFNKLKSNINDTFKRVYEDENMFYSFHTLYTVVYSFEKYIEYDTLLDLKFTINKV